MSSAPTSGRQATAIGALDLDSGNCSVPLGAGLGKAVKAGQTVSNIFIEPQVSVLHGGAGQPDFQLFFGSTTQFLGR